MPTETKPALKAQDWISRSRQYLGALGELLRDYDGVCRRYCSTGRKGICPVALQYFKRQRAAPLSSCPRYQIEKKPAPTGPPFLFVGARPGARQVARRGGLHRQTGPELRHRQRCQEGAKRTSEANVVGRQASARSATFILLPLPNKKYRVRPNGVWPYIFVFLGQGMNLRGSRFEIY